MPQRGFDRDKAARVLIDAQALGDAKAAEKHGLTTRTVERYRARLQADQKLSAIVGAKSAEAERSWHAARGRALRAVMARIEEIAATETDLDKLSRAARNVGEVDVASSTLNVGSRVDPEGPAPAENAGGDPGSPEEQLGLQ